jgi:hypothetical protein
MKSSILRWTTLMGIGAFSALLLSIGAGPAAAITPQPCTTCEPGEGGPPTPPPPPSQPPAYTCQYDDATAPGVPSTGWGPALSVQRATQKTTYAGWCSFACPNASFKWQGPFGAYCDCYSDTIPQLRAAGVDNGAIFNTRYAIWSQPPVTSTRTLLVALAGQNGVSNGVGGGGAHNLTGQPNHWDAACNDWNCGTQIFNPASVVGRLLQAPGMNINASNTFAVSFLDHQSEYYSSNKDKIIKGLVNWLSTKVSPTYLQQIIIIGQSRGGCLSLGLIDEFRIRPAFNQVRILGAPVDGTCEDNGEMGTWSGGSFNIDNPRPDVPGDWYAWRSTFSTANNRSVCIQNTVGGQPQAGPFNVHSFFLGASPWHNTFMNIPHFECGSCFDNYISYMDNGVCLSGGNFHVAQEVVDRALRFVVRNRVQ